MAASLQTQPPPLMNHKSKMMKPIQTPTSIISPKHSEISRSHLSNMNVNHNKYSNDGGAATAVADDSLAGTGMRAADTVLRLLPMGLCVAALIVMLKNSQTNDYGSVSYSDLGAFKFLVHANGICAGYSFLSAVVAAMPRPSSMSKAWALFFLDQLLTYITLAAGTVSSEVLYLAYNGDTETAWSEACGSFGKFCSKARASVVITFVVVALYALISIISSYKLFSRYNAPMADPSKNLEISAFHG